ncbi:MAG: CDP-alcohol phosphatidyltransferase family protein [Gemmatimonadales bacterium]
MVSRSAVPNLLSVVRILGAPILVVVAALRQVALFWAGLGTVLMLDVLDGFVARRLGATSDFGRRLDSAGDYAVVLALIPSVWWLWPAVMRSEAAWLTLIVATYFAPTAYCVVRWQTVPSYHTWAAKFVCVLLSGALVLRLTVGLIWPLHAAALLQLGAMLEEFFIAFTLPGWSGSMPTVRHARRRAIGPK